MKQQPHKKRALLIYIPLILFTIFLTLCLLFDWNWLRPWIGEKASQALGRPLAINGDLRVTWQRDATARTWRAFIPWLRVTAYDIRIGNPSWSRTSSFAHLHKLSFRVAPLGLLAQRVIIPQLQLGQLTIHLERDAQGRANWLFDNSGQADQPSRWRLAVDSIGFDRSDISLRDGKSALTLDIRIQPLQQAIPYNQLVAQKTPVTTGSIKPSTALLKNHYMFAWNARGTYQGMPFRGTGKTGALLALQRNDQPFPLQADMHFGDSHIALAGTLIDPLHLGALDLQLRLSGNSMAELYPILGVTLPDTPPYSTTGRLRARIGSHGSRFSYEHFQGSVGHSDLSGQLSFITGGTRPKLSGKLYSKQLLFADLGPLIGADASPPSKPQQRTAAAAGGKLLPTAPFRTNRWRTMDADVYFSGKRIVHRTQLPLQSLNTHLILHDGVLTLDPLDFGVAGGRVASRLELNSRRVPMVGDLQLRAQHLQLKQLFPGLTSMQTSLGEINGDASLQAQGHSVAALLGSANGELKLLMNNGVISKTLLETAGLNVGNIVIGKLFGDKTVKINCAAADMAAQNGLIKTKLLILDTADAVIYVDGTINLANEQLDLLVRPQTKGFRMLSLRSPLYVKGTLKQPDVGVQTGTLLLRGSGAIALGLLAAPAAALLPLAVPSEDKNKPNLCRTVLQPMRRPAQTRR